MKIRDYLNDLRFTRHVIWFRIEQYNHQNDLHYFALIQLNNVINPNYVK